MSPHELHEPPVGFAYVFRPRRLHKLIQLSLYNIFAYNICCIFVCIYICVCLQEYMNLKFIITLKPEVSYKHALFENLKFSLKHITHENPKFFMQN